MYAIAFIALLLAVFGSWVQTEKTVNETIAPAAIVNFSEADAESFIAYRDAVSAYVKANPTFRGEVPAVSLGISLPAPAITGLGNNVSASSSGSGVVILCFGSLHTGSISSIMKRSDNDASFGVVVDGTNWRTAAVGADVLLTPSPLPVSVPVGDVVSLVQFGV